MTLRSVIQTFRDARRRPRPVSGRRFRDRFPAEVCRLEDRCLLNAGYSLDQWANTPSNAWQNGDLNGTKSSYAEGNVVPFRVDITGLTAGPHTLDIQFRSLDSGLHAYDYITTYNTTEANPPADPLIGITGSSTWTSTTAPIQRDPTLPATVDTTAGNVTGWNSTITSVTYTTTTTGATQYTSYAINFTMSVGATRP